MILAGLVAEPIAADERSLLAELSQHEVAMLDHWTKHPVVPYLEVWQVEEAGRVRIVVLPKVPCVTALP